MLWLLSSTQLKVVAGGVVGADYNAIFRIAATYGIDVTPAFVRYIKCIESVFLEKMNGSKRKN